VLHPGVVHQDVDPADPDRDRGATRFDALLDDRSGALAPYSVRDLALDFVERSPVPRHGRVATNHVP
jgi:hypothetical protein